MSVAWLILDQDSRVLSPKLIRMREEGESRKGKGMVIRGGRKKMWDRFENTSFTMTNFKSKTIIM